MDEDEVADVEGTPPATEPVDVTIYDELTTQYNGVVAQLSEKDATIAALNETISRLKAMNYDLLTGGSDPRTEDAGTTDAAPETDDAPTGGIDDLFEKD